MRTLKPVLTVFLALIWLAGCSTQTTKPPLEPLNIEGKWLMLPLINYSQTPRAGERAEHLVESTLYTMGVNNLKIYPHRILKDGLPDLDDQARFNSAMQWASRQNADYALVGSIEEWRYKSGLDGEPVVGISLKVLKMPGGKVLWAGSGSRAGWAREGLAGTAKKVVDDLMKEALSE